MWPTGFPEMSVQNYHSKVRNNPEKRRSHDHTLFHEKILAVAAPALVCTYVCMYVCMLTSTVNVGLKCRCNLI
jgi:hypothetical protein